MTRTLPTAAACMALALGLAVPLAAHAMRVVRDAGTGELRAPTAAEAAAFEKAEAQLRAHRAAARSAAGQPPARVTGVDTRYPDGTVETSMGEDTHMHSVVSTGADGALQMDCLPAERALKQVKSSPAKKPSAKAGATNATHNATTKAAAHVHQ